jgi:hypothetical protein
MEERTKNLCRHPCFTVRVVFHWQFFNVLEAPFGFEDFLLRFSDIIITAIDGSILA